MVGIRDGITRVVQGIWATVRRLFFLARSSKTKPPDLEVGISLDVASNEKTKAYGFDEAPPNSSPRNTFCGTLLKQNQSIDAKSEELIAQQSIPAVSLPTSPKVAFVDEVLKHHTSPIAKKVKIIPSAVTVLPSNACIHILEPRSNDRAVQSDTAPVPEVAEKRASKLFKSKRHPESISDLLDLFPTVPSHIPQLPLTVSEEPTDESHRKSSVLAELCQSPVFSEKSSFSSDSESNVSTTSASASDDTADTSAPGTPAFSPCTNLARYSAPSDFDEGHIKDTEVFEAAQKDESYIAATSTLVDFHVRPLRPSISTSIPTGLFESYYDALETLEKAALREDNTLEETRSEEKDTCPLVTNSYVAGKVEGLDFYFTESIVMGLVQVAPEIKAHLAKPINPLSIVKKNKRVSEVASVAEGSGKWNDALATVLRALENAQEVDLDFRDLFYGNDSFESEASLTRSVEDAPAAMDDVATDPAAEKRLEESCESNELSMIQLETMTILSSTEDITVMADEPSRSSLLSEDRVVIQNLQVFDDVDATDESPVADLGIAEGQYEDAYTLNAVSDDGDEEYFSSGEGEDDQWSGILELNEYLG
ncbi:hypothetical protein B0H34DRAFT_810257 [Crassisporium funariophilum]|nr:hypothetical protein B0H34DRAFT_810257 [Crassisporium funariophilum]